MSSSCQCAPASRLLVALLGTLASAHADTTIDLVARDIFKTTTIRLRRGALENAFMEVHALAFHTMDGIPPEDVSTCVEVSWPPSAYEVVAVYPGNKHCVRALRGQNDTRKHKDIKSQLRFVGLRCSTGTVKGDNDPTLRACVLLRRVAPEPTSRPCPTFGGEGPELWKMLTRDVQKKTMLDIGATYGDTASCFSNAGFRVIALEPGSRASWMNASVDAASFANIDGKSNHDLLALRAGASSKASNMKLTTNGGDQAFISSTGKAVYSLGNDNHSKSELVPVVRLSDLVHEDIGLFKVDVQGHELNVFLGAIGLLCRHRVEKIFFEYVPEWIRTSSGQRPELLLKLLKELRYDCQKAIGANMLCSRSSPPPVDAPICRKEIK